MCYRAKTPEEQKLDNYLKQYGFTVNHYQMLYNADGFGMPMMPITASDSPKVVQPAMWKLIPHWVKTLEDAKKYANTLNATCEDIFEKASYKNYIGKNRALLWVDGFFEASHPDAKTTVPYYIYSKDATPFSLGCVYSDWLNHDTGEVIRTFSIITTPANELMAGIHNTKQRMPLVIPPDQREKWLGKLGTDEIKAMMHPLPDGILTAHKVSNLVYKRNVDTNVPEVIAPNP